jgi:ABC-type molybdate transport system permease subunit
MAKYESGLRKKLILLVFVIPPVVVGTIIYFIN